MNTSLCMIYCRQSHGMKACFQYSVFENPIGPSSVVVLAYHSTDAASTDGGLELAVQFLNCAGCVEALSKQDDPVQEEKRSNAIDDILHQLYSVKEQCHT